ncbi:cobalt-precorrin-5B (C(1))-methyltransferase CbiD [Calditerrivibrio nitroreducens]|uniref:Cobalt-precorrin-5B C(1)-methyltransferase n=1 Tax=Calditerrivibrio nitroreducens (strain DSM 19672 / NBRC 101217 / Yu37-1) TaxID=768670 RepID=E4TKE1_CALNY|nr:cobalt-precorrin-5B (C(1))-methyltransferase CbiD [Calditerrivibrio nitroreducens]ADR20013.1 cobalamin biosynthesis protein CbiD [Calditerrivibrio nitroreducens DSM 19672]
MKTGITTGTAATAAAKGALIYKLTGKIEKEVEVILPYGCSIKIPLIFKNNLVGVKKWSGDDPDVTDGIEIFASVRMLNENRIIIKGGEGVGIVTKPGLQIPVGEAAINPVPKKMIEKNLKTLLDNNQGVEVTIIVPEGREIAKNTFNKRLGIIDGISIIGTTGIVKPMSVDALIESFKCEIDVLIAQRYNFLWIVPGNIGEKCLLQENITPSVMVSNYFKESFEYLKDRNINEIGVAGHPGKIAKLAMGYFNTHSKNSPQANRFVKEVLNINHDFNTIEELCNSYSFDKIAYLVSKKIKEKFDFTKVSVKLFDMKCNKVGEYLE